MIELRTGLPGAGKTLFAIHQVHELAQREGRTVYYSGIADLRLPWIELPEPEKWYTLPAKSIIVIDEAQRVFRPRHVGSAVPEHVAKLETHRHLGVDLVLITQHPKLLDPNVRRLVGRHIHVVRAFGAGAATLHEWAEVQEDPANRSDSVSRLVPYPKDAFSLYKSAEVHTHKRRIPARLVLLGVIPFGVLALGALAWHFASGFGKSIEDKVRPVPAGVVASASGASPAVSPGAVLDNGQAWFASRVERVPGFPHTAPAFDSVTSPVHAPRPAACLQMGERCTCFTQQATRLPMNGDTCRQIVAGGYFQEWDDAQRVQPQTAQPGPATQAPEASATVRGHPLQAANPAVP